MYRSANEDVNPENPPVIVMRKRALAVHVCASIPPERPEDVVAAVNSECRSGTSVGWVLSDDPREAPVKCGDISGRWHYVLVCRA
jgi:hypothetical protein